MNTHQGTVVADRAGADDEHLVHLLLATQKECRRAAAGRPLPPGPRPFAQFVECTERSLALKVLPKIHGDRHRCEDLVQETYLKVWKGILQFDSRKLGRGGVLAWLFRIAHNTAISQSRRKRPVVGLEALRGADDEWSGFPEPASPEPGPADRAHGNQVGHQLGRAVDELRSDRRAILTMHYMDNLSHKEIAARTGLTAGQVNMKLYAARQEIRGKLESVIN